MSDVSIECLDFSFGPFRLIPERQLLVEGERPVNLGARGLELLHALVEHSGEVVSKDELIARIWPDGSSQSWDLVAPERPQLLWPWLTCYWKVIVTEFGSSS